MRRRLPLLLAAMTAVGTLGCNDAADREHLAALRGDEDGSTRAEVLAHLDRAIELAPDRARYRETRAIYWIDEGAFDRAAEDLDEAIRLADRAYLRFLRGLVACQRGQCENALDDLDAAIEAQPENLQFYRGRSLARSATGDWSGALADAEHLVTLAPRQARAYYARGVALAGAGRDSTAIAEFSEALARRPELIYPLADRAESWARLGDTARARADRETFERRAAGSRCAVCLDPFRY